MTNRDWDGRPAFIALSAVLIVVAYLVGSWQEGQTLRREQADRQARYHSEYAEDSVRRTCSGLQGDILIKCAADAVSASHENQRAEYDLAAQEQMARWAFWLLVLSVGSLGLTFLGVYYVWLTLKETAAGVVTMRNEQRPWLLFDGVDAEYLPEISISGHPPEEAIRFRLKFKNFGASPAIDANVSYYLVPVTQIMAIFGVRDSGEREVVAPGGSIIHTDFLTEGSIADFWEGKLEILFVAQVRYLSPDRSLSGFTSYQIQVSYMDHKEGREDGRITLEVRTEVHVHSDDVK